MIRYIDIRQFNDRIYFICLITFVFRLKMYFDTSKHKQKDLDIRKRYFLQDFPLFNFPLSCFPQGGKAVEKGFSFLCGGRSGKRVKVALNLMIYLIFLITI